MVTVRTNERPPSWCLSSSNRKSARTGANHPAVSPGGNPVRDDVISGYGRGQQASRTVPPIIHAAAWVIVLLGGPVFLFMLGDRLARVFVR